MATAVSAPLGACVRGFPTAERLHPFERALLHLTFGPDMYERRLARLGTLRQSAVEVCFHSPRALRAAAAATAPSSGRLEQGPRFHALQWLSVSQSLARGLHWWAFSALYCVSETGC